MKSLKPHFTIFLLFSLVMSLGFTSCVVHTHHPRRAVVVKQKRMPPGQAKKIYGDKSAKRHAPGQNK